MTDPCAIKNLGDEKYDPGPLDLQTSYYWRVDEVNEANIVLCKGSVWDFTTADYIVIDDFEFYDRFSNIISESWLDGIRRLSGPPWFAYVSGAVVDLGVTYVYPPDPVHAGEQSLGFSYVNDGLSGMVPYYSEAERVFDPAQDWTKGGVEALTLFFYGDPNNDANGTEQMYVSVGDGEANATIEYGYYSDEDMSHIRESEWQAWNIAVAEFSGVDLNGVSRMYIGFGDKYSEEPGGCGVVFFDDLRLYLPKCIPYRLKPVADLTDDCAVDFEDIGVMAAEWLTTGVKADLVSDGSVNFKDYAVLATEWLGRRLWPGE
jgi:hypothetical protein